uniref:DUF4181 domain-containing protein n=1 Tax=Psychrobacillus sp. FSL W7-1457 TaxID=2954547 RepID=UPI00406C8ECF
MIWIKLLLYISLIFVLNIIVSFLLRYSFRIKKEKRSFFSYNHVNEVHQKIDWAFRITFMIILIVVNIMVIIEDYPIQIYIYTSLLYFVIECMVRGFFEYKYSQNPKQSIVTISDGIILSIGLLIVFNYLIDYLG